MIGYIVSQANKSRKKDSSVNAGNAGYRPTTNWREITLRKKKIADLQILTCIVVVGITIIVLGIVLLIFGLFVIKTACPLAWDALEEGCVYISAHNATWAQMRAFCEDQGAQMLQLQNELKNKEFAKLVKGDTWMGLNRPSSTDDFKWLDGEAVDYTNWDPARRFPNPRSSGRFTHCVLVTSEGLWVVEPTCNSLFFGACEYQKSYNPLILIGPVLSVCGIIVLFLSIEVYQRHKHNSKKGAHLMEDEEYLIKKKPPDVEAALPGGAFASASASGEEPPSSKKLPRKKKKRRTPPKKPAKGNKVGAEGATSFQDLEVEDSIKITRSHQGSAETDQLELLLSPRNL